ncbi:MAG: nitroreductase family protein [Candidatus Neomarinimicrobiota bacterium]
MDDTLKTILKRRSLRAYAKRPIEPEHRDQILEATLRSPTAGNLMLYSIVEVTDQAVKDRLVNSCDNQPFIAKAPLVWLFLADYQRWWDAFQAGDVPGYCQREGLEFRKPTEGDLMIASCDALIAAQTAVIAAEALGIGSCYIGDIMENYEFHRDLFGLPPYVFPITLLCFGYPRDGGRDKPLSPRYPAEYIIHENKYRRFDAATHNRVLAERKADRFDGNAENFAQHIYYRKYSAAFTLELNHSVRAILANWTGK